MTKMIYKTIQGEVGANLDTELNKLGDDGWKLVGVAPYGSGTGAIACVFEKLAKPPYVGGLPIPSGGKGNKRQF